MAQKKKTTAAKATDKAKGGAEKEPAKAAEPQAPQDEAAQAVDLPKKGDLYVTITQAPMEPMAGSVNGRGFSIPLNRETKVSPEVAEAVISTAGIKVLVATKKGGETQEVSNV